MSYHMSQTAAPNGGVAPVQSQDASLVMKFIGSWVASSAAGAYGIGGADFMDFATSFTGGLGAAVGYTAGCYIANMPATSGAVAKVMDAQKTPMSGDGNYKMILPIAGAVAVPALASGALDTDVAILAAGAFAGGYIVSYYYKKQ